MTTVFSASTITVSTEEPLYPKGQGYGVRLDNQWLRLAPDAQQPVRFYTRDSLAQRSDDSGSVYQNVLDIGYSWQRDDVSGGEGLDYDPRLRSVAEGQEAQDQIRFWDSNNIDIRRPLRGEPYTFSLSHTQEIWRTEATLVDLTTSDDFLYVAFGSTVEWWSSWTAGPANTESTTSDIAKIVASPDGDVVALLDDGTVEYYTTVSGVFTPNLVLSGVENVWFVKGRFVALVDTGTEHELREFDDDPNVVGEPFDTFRGVCYSMVSSGPAIVAAIDDGTLRSYVPEQANQQDPDSVNLVIRGRTEVPDGEVAYLLGSNAGVLLVLTRTTKDASQNNVRLYQAEVLDSRFDYTVGQLRLRREWTGTSEVIDIRQNMATTRDEIWATIQETPTEDMIWRFDLVTLGLSRHRTSTLDNTHSIVIFDEDVGFIEATNVWKSNENYMDEGYLMSPNITFGLNTDISWLAGVLTASNIVSSGRQVSLLQSLDPEGITDPDHPSWVEMIRISSTGQSNSEALLEKQTSRTMALQVRIFSSELQTRSPRVARFAIRGIPIHRDWILELPINISDYISAPGRRPIRIPTYGDEVHRYLMGKIGDNSEVVVLDPPFGFRGVLDNIIEPTEYITDRGSVGVRCVLQFRGSRITTPSTSIGDAGLGLGLLGVAHLGIGQTERT